jgi:hypothetical protein
MWSDMSLRFIEGAARAMFVQEWAYDEEEQGRTYWGMNLMNIAPATPVEVKYEAAALLGRLEQLNGVSLPVLIHRAEEADGKPVDPERFGHYIALQALGHGVGWFDDHAAFDLKVPDIEVW